MTVILSIVNAITHHKGVWNIKADPTDLNLSLTPRGFVQQTAHIKATRLPGFKDIQHLRQRMSGVYYILNHQNISASNIPIKVFEDTYLTAGMHGTAITGYRHEIHLNMQIKPPHQISYKDK